MPVKAILTDIEGTTTSIEFVHEVLFPYARTHMKGFLQTKVSDPKVQQVLSEIDPELDFESLVERLDLWMAEDRKITSLKTLQGLLWEEGYRRGDFKAHLYPEVHETLKLWKAKGLALYVYSSGSKKAQKLLFEHTLEGDITSLFDGFFDTTVGAKRDVSSYNALIKHIKLPPSQVLFLSDSLEELEAAQDAGFMTALVCRGSKIGNTQHRTITNFKELNL